MSRSTDQYFHREMGSSLGGSQCILEMARMGTVETSTEILLMTTATLSVSAKRLYQLTLNCCLNRRCQTQVLISMTSTIAQQQPWKKQPKSVEKDLTAILAWLTTVRIDQG